MEQLLLGTSKRCVIVNHMNKATYDGNIKNNTKVSGIEGYRKPYQVSLDISTENNPFSNSCFSDCCSCLKPCSCHLGIFCTDKTIAVF